MMRLILCAVLLLTLRPAAAQTFGQVEERRSTSRAYFVHVLPGEATVVASVWGTVQLPGTYEVGDGTDMGQLLSLAGGPIFAPLRQSDEVELARQVRVQLYRQEGGARVLAYDEPLARVVASPDAYPVVRDGDIVEVTTYETERRRWTWRDSATVGSLVATGALTLLQVFLIVR